MSLSPSPTTPPSELRQWIVDIGSRIGVRARSVLAVAVVVVCVALLIGESALVWMLQSSLNELPGTRCRARASEIVTQLTTDGLAATREEIADRTRPNSVVRISTTEETCSSPPARTSPRPLFAPSGTRAYGSVETDHLSARATAVEGRDDGGPPRFDPLLRAVRGPGREQAQTIEIIAMMAFGRHPAAAQRRPFLAVWLLVRSCAAARCREQIRGTVAEIDAQRLAGLVTGHLEARP